jgi:hypothetical protein
VSNETRTSSEVSEPRNPQVSITIEEGLAEHRGVMTAVLKALLDANQNLGSIMWRAQQVVTRQNVLVLLLIGSIVMMLLVVLVGLSTQGLQRDMRVLLETERVARTQLQTDLTTAVRDVKQLTTRLDEVNERTKTIPTIKSEGGQLKLEIPLDEESKKQAQAKLNSKKTILDKPAPAPDTVLIPLRPAQSVYNEK